MLREGAKYPKNGEELISFGFSSKKWCSEEQLGHNTSSSPNIDRCGIFGQANYELWRSIIAGNYIGSVFSQRIDDFGASKITNFDDSFF